MNDTRLTSLLACPRDGQPLEMKSPGLRCQACGHMYPATGGRICLLPDASQRPTESVNLARVPEIGQAEIYERNLAAAKHSQLGHAEVRGALERIAARGGAIVDLASGPGGGYIASLLELTSPATLVLGTDACEPVAEHQARLFARDYPDRFRMLDVDLAQRLPFQDGSVSAFTGSFITNIASVSYTLQEMSRCLSPDGRAVLGDRFYAEASETAEYLQRSGHPFASVASLERHVRSLGFTVTRTIDIVRRVGKTEPGDGLPLSESDEWTWTLLEFARSA